MSKKFIMISMDDEKSKHLADVLGNKSCKKIIDSLAEVKEASQKEISDTTGIPMNTLDYNMKKLLDSGLVEKTSNHFWSSKGKKIPTYKLSNKSIIISPKSSSKIKTLLTMFGITALATILVKYFYSAKDATQNIADETYSASLKATEIVADNALNTEIFSLAPIWTWFLAGALFAIVLFTIINWRKL